MLRLGLTGGIGAGKSTVSKELVAQGGGARRRRRHRP
ncbi:dephospho-CoA kinase [Rhodococcus zopfii]|uniref:Dephospho-CoA kinase n=1 Tax=Rhodococcus zopfii TaxID=43772 RepID=A0ABU3WN41_9NOCA|nr:dephospho-CoA kinase [Rhodococcus zopfii]